jgi:hypothetical protein
MLETNVRGSVRSNVGNNVRFEFYAEGSDGKGRFSIETRDPYAKDVSWTNIFLSEHEVVELANAIDKGLIMHTMRQD